MAEIKIEGMTIRTEEIVQVKPRYDGSAFNTTLTTRFDGERYLKMKANDFKELIRGAEAKDREDREDALAKKIAENLIDVLDQREQQKEAEQRAKPKKSLKIG